MSEHTDSSGWTPSERRLLGQISAHSQWARLNADARTSRTAPARAALFQKFVDAVDPERELDSDERARRARHAFNAHMARLALRAVRARRLAAALESESADAQARLSELTDPEDEL